MLITFETNSNILAVKMLDDVDESTTSTLSSALGHQINTFDIYSNSWGFVNYGNISIGLTDAMKNAIDTGIQLVYIKHIPVHLILVYIKHIPVHSTFIYF